MSFPGYSWFSYTVILQTRTLQIKNNPDNMHIINQLPLTSFNSYQHLANLISVQKLGRPGYNLDRTTLRNIDSIAGLGES